MSSPLWQALRRQGRDPRDCTAAVQGFGKVGALAARYLSDEGIRVVAVSDVDGGTYDAAGLDIFGPGPQGVAHVETLRDVGLDLVDVTFVARTPGRGAPLPEARVVLPEESGRWVREADVVVCATTSPMAVFDSREVKQDAVVIAVGPHQPHVREIDAALVGRSQVIVEDVGTALRECGDVVRAIDEGALSESELIRMADVVRGPVTLDDSRPVLYKGSGMSWQDLVVAEAAVQRRRATVSRPRA